MDTFVPEFQYQYSQCLLAVDGQIKDADMGYQQPRKLEKDEHDDGTQATLTRREINTCLQLLFLLSFSAFTYLIMEPVCSSIFLRTSFSFDCGPGSLFATSLFYLLSASPPLTLEQCVRINGHRGRKRAICIFALPLECVWVISHVC